MSFIFSSCVLIQESRNKKKLAEVGYVKVYEEDKDTFEVSEKKIVVKDKTTTNTIEDSDKIWYHPNPWWRIASKPFPIKDNVAIRNSPQYQFSNYVDPLTNQTDMNIWNDWQKINHQNYNEGSIIHNWQAFITIYKDIFSKHAEYLAEIDDKRLGYGKTSKLCVTNKNMQKLYIDYTIKRIKDNPQYKYYSVEPSDGAGFCTCVNCSKLGSISNQVYYFANQIAKQIKVSYPDKQLGLYAYYTHSDPPNFKLENNIKVVLAPEGFQTKYSNMGMMLLWINIHKNLGLREYFGIPQWKGEQPRIIIQNFINRIEYAQLNNFDLFSFESGTNLNATLLMALLSQMIMNSELKWSEVYNKFLEDCFKDSKVPIQRLFDRWHSTDVFNTIEINYSLNDLKEASQLTKNENETQRIRDLKAYVHYLILLENFNKDRTNSSALKNYFDYLYNSNNRNIVNTYALTRILEKAFVNDVTLKSKYTYNNTKDKNWIKYITDQQIDDNFKNDLKSYPPIFKEKISNQEINNIAKKASPTEFLESYQLPIKARNSMDIYSSNTNINITATYIQKDIQTMVSIYAKEGVFIQQKLLNNNESWMVQLPEPGIYTIMQNRVASVQINLKGKFSPILTDAPKTLNKEHTIRTINKKLQLEPLDKTQPADKTNSIYIITK